MAEGSGQTVVLTGAAGGMDAPSRRRSSTAPTDIARSIVFALDQPAHVQIAEMMILPVNRY
jgi:NADP-dependent 3-hydroxy acid dehydrogenase YdfG